MAGQVARLETFFKALGDGTRLRILGLLLTGEVCVCHIHESLGIPQSRASRHLAYLRRAGLVATRRDGLWIHYRMAPMLDPVLKTVRDAVAHALTHLNTVGRDARRLKKKTGGCLPAAADSGLPCCVAISGPVAQPGVSGGVWRGTPLRPGPARNLP